MHLPHALLLVLPALIHARALLFPSNPSLLPGRILTADEAPLVRRQSMAWADPYISAPVNFTVTHISDCNYMLTFQRDALDTRYRPVFEVRHASHSLALRDLSRIHDFDASRIAPDGRYARYVLSAHQLNDACSAGSFGVPPEAFRVSFSIEGRAYAHDWISDPIYPEAGTRTPNAVRGVKVVSIGDNLQVTWEPVEDAVGYYVLVEGERAVDQAGNGAGEVAYETFVADGQTANVVTVPKDGARRAIVKARGKDGVLSGLAGAQVVTVQ